MKAGPRVRTIYEKADTVPLIAEVFRELGYEGASFSRITARTGLSKGSLYNFFPKGKEEMAAAVLDHIHGWFETHIFTPLEQELPGPALETMWRQVCAYFQDGGRVCLVGVFALDETRDRFSVAINGYFTRWIETLASVLMRAGVANRLAQELAEVTVSGIQGALVLARARGETALFMRMVAHLQRQLEAALSQAD
ncbi:TetR/AcrR family transcriptional regulator [Xanthobacter sp. TB0139]|uniref:TetR/AcrR family transcriptional regulator n=1 Tax=Xanthobacter sp. TB0139 TaxID=3459178 RepID=UPI00403979A0